jgi:hypothetical protein
LASATLLPALDLASEILEIEMAQRVYVASSWRSTMFDATVNILEAAGVPHYNFKKPSSDLSGFSWSEVMEGFDINKQEAVVADYLEALGTARATEAFEADFAAMQDCDTFVLVLPCGKSAHLELGWAVGAGKRTAILLDTGKYGTVQPELMYKMVDLITPSVMDLLKWLGVKD